MKTLSKDLHFLQLLAEDREFPMIPRTAGRAVIGSLNAMCVSLIRAHMMAMRFGTPHESLRHDGEERFELPHPSVDSRNRLDAEVAGEDLRAKARHDQGFDEQERPLAIAARAKLVRDALDKQLHAWAGERDVIVDGKTVIIPDPMHVGNAFENTLDFMAGGTGLVVPEMAIDAELAALGVTADAVKRAGQRQLDRMARQRTFLRDNKAEIIATYKSLIPSDRDGFALSLEQYMTAFDNLPAYQRMSCLASADRALYRAFEDQLLNYQRGSVLALGNIAMIQTYRRWIRAERLRWATEEKFMAEYREQVLRANGREPIFEAAPPADVAEKKAA